MKNIQVIDDADNSKYSIYAATEAEFDRIFSRGADIEFAEDFFDRIGEEAGIEITKAIWARPVAKEKVQGIHGTLFYGLKHLKQKFYPTKRFSDDKYG